MTDDAREVSFEEALSELEQIVQRLESGELSLEDSLGQYERGVARLRACYQLLEQAETRIQLLEFDAKGRPTERPFDERPDA
jgi:exodeoxyribonuclease VII small subunit